jgi:hypothetical protein
MIDTTTEPKPATTPLVDESFGNDVLRLLKCIEVWSDDERKELAADDKFPPFGTRAAIWSGVWFGVAQTCSWLMSWSGKANMYWLFWLSVAGFFVGIGASLFLWLARAPGMGSTGFWIDMWSTFTTKSNYPFTPLRNCAERDLKSVSRLEGFSVNVLKAGRERIDLEEAELRERLNAIAGSPSFMLPITLLAAGWTAWKNFNEASNIFTILVLITTSLSFGLCLFAATHRALLIRLARSRALLALEIARRLSFGEEPARP